MHPYHLHRQLREEEGGRGRGGEGGREGGLERGRQAGREGVGVSEGGRKKLVKTYPTNTDIPMVLAMGTRMTTDRGVAMATTRAVSVQGLENCLGLLIAKQLACADASWDTRRCSLSEQMSSNCLVWVRVCVCVCAKLLPR